MNRTADSFIDLRAAVSTHLAAGNVALARQQMAAYLEAMPNAARAQTVLTSFREHRGQLAATTCRVALLRSATVEPLVPMFLAQAAVQGIDIELQVGDFGTYAQDILDPASRLYAFDPTVVVLFVHTADVAPELWERFTDLDDAQIDAVVARVSADFDRWLGLLRERTKAHVIVHGITAPLQAQHGVLDAQLVHGQEESVRRINHNLLATVRRHASTYRLDLDALSAKHGRAAWHDERLWRQVRLPVSGACLHHLTNEWMRFLTPLVGRQSKVLAVDLDNTLWGGVVGEDGVDGIALGPELPGLHYLNLQRAILDLYHRGIVLAVCSKNNEADALEAMRRHSHMLLKPEHFAALRINWTEKAANLRSIASELNLGIDSLAFLDDNPFECEQVRCLCPEVSVIQLGSDPARHADTVHAFAGFQRLVLSEEDRSRSSYYAGDRLRADLKVAASSLEDFYRSLQMEADIARVEQTTQARIAQLTQKTNQFNLTTRRYSEQQIRAMADDPRYEVYGVRLKDRYGDNGLVGVAILQFSDAAEARIDSFLLSCRVIGRTLETALLARLIESARARQVSRVVGSFLPTKKNGLVKDFFANHGFIHSSETSDGQQWTLDVAAKTVARPPWIAMQ
jgi:FkbH-like protein